MNGCFHQLFLKLVSELGYVNPSKSSSTSTTPLNSPLRSPYPSFYSKDNGLQLHSKKPTDQEFLDGIQPIFMMIKHKDSTVESRIQAAKMLCDVSGKNICYLELEAFRIECASALKALLTDDDADVRQYAVMATAAFAELPCYVKLFLDSSILVAMFELVESTPSPEEAYATAQVRRTAASLLAILSKSHPYIVKAELEKQHCDVERWLKNTSYVSSTTSTSSTTTTIEEDVRTRESIMFIRTYLADIPSIIIINSNNNNSNSSMIMNDDDEFSIDGDLMISPSSSSTHNLIL